MKHVMKKNSGGGDCDPRPKASEQTIHLRVICGGNSENGVYIDYMAYNAYFHVLFENPDSFFSRVTRYGFFKFCVLLKNGVR